MKRIMMTFFILSFSACTPVVHKNYTIMEIKNATVGSPMISYESKVEGLYPSGYKWELVYAGIDKNTLQIDYREYAYSNNSWLIKDGFTQHLKYDIEESNTIVYKNYELEIIEANSSWIKYRVTRDDISASTSPENANQPSRADVSDQATFSEPYVDTTAKDMEDMVAELSEDEKPTYIAIRKVLNRYILLHQGSETPMFVEDEYPIVRDIGSGELLKVGTAKVVKIKGSAVALKSSIESGYEPVTIRDRVQYIKK